MGAPRQPECLCFGFYARLYWCHLVRYFENDPSSNQKYRQFQLVKLLIEFI